MRRDTILGIDATGDKLHVALSRGGAILGTFAVDGIESLAHYEWYPRIKGAYFTGTLKELFIRRLSLPYMPRDEIREAIRWELKSQGVPFDISTAVIGYHTIGETTTGEGARHIEVMAAAAGIKESDAPAAQLKSVGLELLGISAVPFAVWEFIKGAQGPKETVCIAHIGQRETYILLGGKERLELIRDIQLGKSTFVEAMTGQVLSDKGKMEFSGQQADEVLSEFGIPEETDIVEGVSGFQLLPLLRPALEKLTNELRRSIEYYKNELDGSEVEKIILTGTGAATKGMAQYLSKDLALPVAASDAPQFACACGLVKGGGLNILADEYRHANRRSLERISARMVAFSFIGLFVFLYIGLRIIIVGLERQLEAETAHWNNLQPISFLCEAVGKRIEASELALRGDVPINEAMKVLSNTVSGNILLEELTYTKSKNELRIRGQVSQGGTTSEENLAQFLSALERQSMFRDATLIKVDKDEGDVFSARFELICKIGR